jgi:hypothetical protein
MTLRGFELVIPGNERPQIHALDREATGIGSRVNMNRNTYVTFMTSLLCESESKGNVVLLL